MTFLESRNDQQAAVADAVAGAADMPHRSSGARESIEAQLARVGQRFEWGDITAEDYRDKREWLLVQRAEMSTFADIAPRKRLTGLLDAWDRSDALGRRELLAALLSSSTYGTA